MDPVRWERLESICYAALELEGDGRTAFIDEACGDDAALHADVTALLGQIDADPVFLERPIVDLAALTLGAPAAVPPDSIGPYRIIRRLGRGGMGEVYLAERATEDLRQTVALKIIRRGMNTDEVLRRFRLERRILASLDHPNIARLLDAGATDDGQPYFVMEYVAGSPITSYCDDHALPVRDRLRLFQTVCGAVQHAHQNLIVHRDLKPRNILVNEGGLPKLLDFGIGKVLGHTDTLDPTADTRTELRLLTPQYAAPEQVAGGPVTTATDVYGLGILLYELLTGRHPYVEGGETLKEVERAVLEANPTRPRRLNGDLDNIVLKALRKEPERRYASAAAFAEDIQRHLDGLPVLARADSVGYRTRKFVRRNLAAVGAAAIVILALVATTVITLIQSRRVTAESARVAEERDKALEVRGFLLEMFGATGGSQAVGDTVSAKQLLDRQAALLDAAYADRPALKADMMEVLADGYDRLGLLKAASPLAEQALELRRSTLSEGHPDIAAALNLDAWIQHELGKSKDAEPQLREAVAIRRAAGPRFRGDLSRSLNDLGVILNALSRYPDAETVLTEALEIRQNLGSQHRAVGITANNLAAAYYYQSKLDDAVRVQHVAVEALRKSVGPEHQRTVVALSNLASFKRTQGDLESAEADYRDLIALQSRLQGRDHPVTGRVILALAGILHERGLENDDQTSIREAEAMYREILGSFEAKLGASHPQVGTVLERLGGVVTDLGEPKGGLALAERGLALLRNASGNTNQSTATAMSRVAHLHWRNRRVKQTLELQREAVAAFEQAVGARHPETARAQVALCEYVLESAGDANEALGLCEKAEQALRTAPGGFRKAHALAKIRSAQAHLALGHAMVADSILTSVRFDTAGHRFGRVAARVLDSLSRD